MQGIQGKNRFKVEMFETKIRVSQNFVSTQNWFVCLFRNYFLSEEFPFVSKSKQLRFVMDSKPNRERLG